MLPDPYEAQNITVKCSRIRGGGEGKLTFANKYTSEILHYRRRYSRSVA